MTQHLYTAGYCEENIWHLCADPTVPGTDRQVIWIGSLQQFCPLWCQSASESPEQPVWWDYHVILLALTDQWRVWDLDTTLPLPVASDEYFTQTFRTTQPTAPIFRVMDADYYRNFFSSNRSHMRRSGNQWLATPPQWPAIQSENLTMSEMLDFSSVTHGDLTDLNGVVQRFGLS